jgi:predicted transglutaminase-like protease
MVLNASCLLGSWPRVLGSSQILSAQSGVTNEFMEAMYRYWMNGTSPIPFVVIIAVVFAAVVAVILGILVVSAVG